MILPERESYHKQKRRLLAPLAMRVGGRVAEEGFCGDISAGASADIQRATEIARAMVTELGMSEKIGPISYAERQGSDFLGTELMRSRQHSEETAREIDQEIRAFLDEAYHRAKSIIRENHDGIESLVEALLAYETLNGDEVSRLLAGAPVQGLRPPKKEAEPERRPPTAEPRRQPKSNEGGEGQNGGVVGPTPA
jgi:cell division protease FtsH